MPTNMTTHKTGAELIAEERQRQIDQKGWTPEHDSEHDNGELLSAAFSYLHHVRANYESALTQRLWEKQAECAWPFSEFFTPGADKIRNLQKAGALIAAEIDRLQRIH